MHCGLSVYNHMIKAARRAKIVSAFVLRLLLRVWSAKTRRPPKLSPMADDAITRGGIGSLVSPLYICGMYINMFKYVSHYCRAFATGRITAHHTTPLDVQLYIRA